MLPTESERSSPSTKKKDDQEEEFRAAIQYLMMDEKFFKENDESLKKCALKKLMAALESLAWLHNCDKIQS